MRIARLVMAVLIAASACAKSAAETAPTVLVATTPSGEIVLIPVELGDPEYLKMSVGAAGWIRHIVPAKTIGIYQPDLAPPALQEMIEKVTRVYAFRPIRLAEFRVQCTSQQPSSGQVKTAEPVCSMANAEAIVQFNMLRMARDSGYVGGIVTQVPRGATRSENSPFCITVARHGMEWVPIRSRRVEDPRRCPR